MTETRDVAPHVFRNIMAAVCAPVTVVTTVADGDPVGATVSAFGSLSLDPPLITVAFDRNSWVLNRIQDVGRFGVNVLGHAQSDVALRFATRGVDRFTATDWYLDDGLPRIDGASGWLNCDLHEAVPGGDHILLLGRVVDAGIAEYPPLVYAHRTFGTHSRFHERPRPPITDCIAACSRQ